MQVFPIKGSSARCTLVDYAHNRNLGEAIEGVKWTTTKGTRKASQSKRVELTVSNPTGLL